MTSKEKRERKPLNAPFQLTPKTKTMNDSNLSKEPKPTVFSETKNTENLTFTESERSKYPISRLNSGKIAFLDLNGKRSRKVQSGETWLCEIVSNMERKAIVNPIEIINTITDNEIELKQKIEALKQKYQK
jgi:hypothetical protein